MSRSGYDAYLKRKGTDRDAEAKRLILTGYRRYEGKYGYRQLQLFLWQDDGVWMNQKKVLRLMQLLGLQARICRKRRLSMTYQAAERKVLIKLRITYPVFKNCRIICSPRHLRHWLC